MNIDIIHCSSLSYILQLICKKKHSQIKSCLNHLNLHNNIISKLTIWVLHSGDRVGFGQMSFGSVVFQIGHFSDAYYGGSHSGQVGYSRFS